MVTTFLSAVEMGREDLAVFSESFVSMTFHLLVLQKITWADIVLFNGLDFIELITGRDDFCASYPLITKLRANVAATKGIKEYLAARSY